MATKKNLYAVQASLNLIVLIEIEASSLKEATEKSASLKEENFVTIEGEYVDGSIEITGVFKN